MQQRATTENDERRPTMNQRRLQLLASYSLWSSLPKKKNNFATYNKARQDAKLADAKAAEAAKDLGPQLSRRELLRTR